jgi:DNA polymerase elongation subunit (family B)
MVDCIYKQLLTQKMNDSQLKMMIQKMILTSFQYDKFDDIDIVYPKKTPSKNEVKAMIKKLIEEPISCIQTTSNEVVDLLTIDSMFEQMKEMQTEAIETMENDDNEENDETNEVEEKDENNNQLSFKKKIKSVKTEKKSTIVDVLNSEKYERDEKITILNDVLTRIFPRLEGDKVTFIGSTFMRYGEQEPYMNHCIVLGSCDPVDGAIIESVNTERDILLQWTELIQRENPDIIIGYNIFGFDYEFMFRRSEELHCEFDFLKLSRKMGEICGKQNKDGTYSIENTKIVLASGEYDLRYPKIAGRLQIDMYAYFRRDFNLSSYKLDDVAGQYISDDVKRIELNQHEKYGDVTELYSQNLTGLHIGDYIHIEISSFTSDYYKDGHKFKVVDIQKKEVNEVIKGKEVTNNYNVIIIRGHEDIDKTKSIKWGMAKDDVTPQDIFRLSNGSASDRAIVAKYCIQDCNLVHHLMNKIDVITGYVEMSRICSIPISFLIFRGQGIKLTSYVAKECRKKDTLMPDLEKSTGSDSFEGAIVLPPKCSMYMDNPVACVDYSSLYPSSMISQNLSHDSKVWTKEYNLDGKLIKESGERDKDGNYVYDNLPDYYYIDLEFDLFEWRRNPLKPSSRAEKIKTGKKVCRWAQFPDDKKGIMPTILQELLKARSDTRKLIKTEKDPFMQNILDKRQLGYKVTANSLYGQCGAKTSTFYEKDVAACTTATGRMMITYARRIIEEVYGDRVYDTAVQGPVLTKAEYVYGDSVADYTPIKIRFKHYGEYVSMDTFIMDVARRCGDDNWITCEEPGKQTKEYCELKDVETWSEKGWTKIHRVIRHKLASHKKMFRIITDNGIVDVTDDHSLLDKDGNEISPNQCQIGTELLHQSFYEYDEKENFIPQAKPKKYYEETLTLDEFPNVCLLRLDDKLENKTIDNKCNIIIRIDASTSNDCKRNHFLIASVYNLFAKYNIFMETSYSNYRNEFVLTYDPCKEFTKYNNKIKQIIEIPYEGYVYDLTTDNHHFSAGIGNFVVHNTDSVFFTFNLQDPVTKEKIRGKKALEITIEIAQDAAKLCSQWLKPPMDLAYEKTLMPFILLSKKRYVGMLYEEDPNKGKLKYMGLSLKRRDSCDYLKDTYGSILNILMKEHDVKKSIEFLDESLENLIKGNVNMEKLMITKSLRGYYKNPNTIAHKVLSERIGQRDPGNKPKPGDRMKFVHIVNNNKKALQGEKIETPEFITQNKVPIDYSFYITNQLMKPLQQLFGLALEQIWEYQGKGTAIQKFKKEMCDLEKEFPDLEIFMKKKEKICSSKIKVLLFDKYLTKINNAKNGIQEISSFFVKL